MLLCDETRETRGEINNVSATAGNDKGAAPTHQLNLEKSWNSNGQERIDDNYRQILGVTAN